MSGPHSKQSGRVSLRSVIILATVVAIAAFLFWPEMPRNAAEPTSHSTTAQAPSDREGHDGHAHDAHDAHHSNDAPDAAAELYTCGMHPQVLAEQPGSCPICSMRLTPVRVSGALDAEGSNEERKIHHWRAPMDPSYVSDRPGKSPMGMDLIPVYDDELGSTDGMSISISPVVVQNMGVRSTPVLHQPLRRTIRTVGSIDYDETGVREVATKFDGWIEELHADYTGQRIETGMPLFSIYSRELYSTQEEYLLALRNRDSIDAKRFPEAARDIAQLVASARLRLKLFDIGDAQIDELARRGTPTKAMTIVSPHTGTVVEKTARDGMHVTPGTKLYTIADLSSVWVYVDIYERAAPFVKLGQQATMRLSYLPGESFTGKVVYVYPFVATETRTIKVRLEFDNPHLMLKPGMFADVEIQADLKRTGLVVPRSAVLDTGTRQVVFVRSGAGRFQARTVDVGLTVEDEAVEILSGVAPGEQVVTSGQFLLDSESKLREAVLKMMERQRGARVEQARETRPAEQVERIGEDDRQPHPAARSSAAGNRTAAAEGGSDQTQPTLARLAEPTRELLDAYLDLHEILADGDESLLAAGVVALNPPLQQLAAAAAALAGNDADRAGQLVTTTREASRAMDGRSIDTIRARYNDLSQSVMALSEIAGVDVTKLDVHAFRCPMAGGDWLQRGSEPRNPYYGFAMLRCGDPLEPPPGMMAGRLWKKGRYQRSTSRSSCGPPARAACCTSRARFGCATWWATIRSREARERSGEGGVAASSSSMAKKGSSRRSSTAS